MRTKTDYQNQVIFKLKSLREEKQYTQAFVANFLGISPGQLGNIESNRMPHKFTLKQIYILCELFSVEMADLFLLPSDKMKSIDIRLLMKRIIQYQENEII